MTQNQDLKLPVKIHRDAKESLKELISSGIYNENILNNLTSNIVITDRDFNITYLNPAAEKSLSLSRDAVLGKNLFSVGAPNGMGFDLKSNLDAILEKGGAFTSSQSSI